MQEQNVIVQVKASGMSHKPLYLHSGKWGWFPAMMHSFITLE